MSFIRLTSLLVFISLFYDYDNKERVKFFNIGKNIPTHKKDTISLEKDLSDVKEDSLSILFIDIKKKGSDIFINGIDNAVNYKSEQVKKGVVYKYKGSKTFNVYVSSKDKNIIFTAREATESQRALLKSFKISDTNNAVNNWMSKNTSSLILGQYDFNGDGKPELILAIQDKDKKELNRGLYVTVFKLNNSNHWSRMGEMVGLNILGYPYATIKNGRITMPLNQGDYKYEWIYEFGTFRKTDGFQEGLRK